MSTATAASSQAKVDPRNNLNDLTAAEWIPETVSVWTQRGLGAKHPDAQIERQHPAPFSFTDVGRLIRFFTKANDVVLDPFVGIGSTLKSCAIEGRRGIGIELNPKYVELARERLRVEVRDMFSSVADQRLIQGDARKVLPTLEEDSVHFIVTSPPYWNILHKEDRKVKQERTANSLDTRYSDHPADLGNIADYETFLHELATILSMCRSCLLPKRYMAVVVSDFRHRTKFHMFHADLVHALLPSGLELKGIKVLYQRHKKIFPYGYPFAYVPNVHHQYILILQNIK
ncbi:MAG: DNA methyltransferase [Phycisphaerales bacterium JB039]